MQNIEHTLTPLDPPVISRSWRITGPWSMEEREDKIDSIPSGQVLLRVLRVGVCHGDLRYLAGQRPAEVLKQRLPLVPFHEAVAQVMAVAEDVQSLSPGDRVVPVPNLPCSVVHPERPPCESCRKGPGENYCREVRFLGSNVHGFGRTHLLHPATRCLKIPPEVPWEIAFMTEPFSVAFHASRVGALRPEASALVLGAGVLGGMATIALSASRNLPPQRLFVDDPQRDRMTALSRWASPWEEERSDLDLVLECVGGSATETTVRKGLERLKPGGTFVLLGVPQSDVLLPFRPLMDKGLLFRGVNRSAIQDYARALGEMRRPEVRDHLRSLIWHVSEAKGPEDLVEACRLSETPGRIGRVCVDIAEPA